MSKNMEIRRPSAIARLMGLDMLPPVVPKQKKEVETCFKKTSSVGSQENFASFENYSLCTGTNEHQEFKDVFEVVETPKVEKKSSQPIRKGLSSMKQSEIDMAFTRKKFMDAKQFSIDEVLSRELNDALEVLDSDEDIFSEFLQEPHSLFNKHLQDLRCAPSSRRESHITILKSSKDTKFKNGGLSCKSERNVKRCIHSQRGDISSFSKPATGYVCQSLKEHIYSLPHKSKSPYAEKAEACLQPTQIVVLKPRLEKAQYATKTVSQARSPENSHFSLSRHREIPLSEILESYAGGRGQQKLLDTEEVMGHDSKGSRETARENTKQMRNTGIRGSKKVTSKFHGYISDESSCDMPGRACHFDGCSNNSSPSLPCSTELSVSREARKRLSERWRMTREFQEVGHGRRGSSTLGEMLALSDRETPRTTLGASIIRKVSGRMARDEALVLGGCSLGVSNDGWKDGCSGSFPRSKSLPASSFTYENIKSQTQNQVGSYGNYYVLKDVLMKTTDDSSDGNFIWQRSPSHRSFPCHCRKAKLHFSGEENKLPEREVHVSSRKMKNRIHVRHPVDQEQTIPESPDDSVANRGHLDHNFSASHWNHIKYSPSTNEKEAQQQNHRKYSPSTNEKETQQQHTALKLLASDGEHSSHHQNSMVIKETSIGHPQLDSLPSHCHKPESSSPVVAKEADQPSPVSVLEPTSEEEKSSSGCFEKINADLQELRMQLKLLKLESSDSHAEELGFLMSSDEDTGGECHSFLQLGETPEAFRNVEDRDFSYLLDLLIESGVHGADRVGLFNACHSMKYPVDPGVFDRLEKKYSVLLSWSRSERKLLFDLINSILADFVNPFIDLNQKVNSRKCWSPWAREGLVEEAWQMIVRRRQELSCNQEEKHLEPKWLDLREDIDTVERDLERMLNDDLIEDIVSELISEQAQLHGITDQLAI